MKMMVGININIIIILIISLNLNVLHFKIEEIEFYYIIKIIPAIYKTENNVGQG